MRRLIVTWAQVEIPGVPVTPPALLGGAAHGRGWTWPPLTITLSTTPRLAGIAAGAGGAAGDFALSEWPAFTEGTSGVLAAEAQSYLAAVEGDGGMMGGSEGTQGAASAPGFATFDTVEAMLDALHATEMERLAVKPTLEYKSAMLETLE